MPTLAPASLSGIIFDVNVKTASWLCGQANPMLSGEVIRLDGSIRMAPR